MLKYCLLLIFVLEYPPTDSGSGDTGPLPCVPLTGLIVAWAVRGGCKLTSNSQFTRSLNSKTKIHQSKLKQCFLFIIINQDPIKIHIKIMEMKNQDPINRTHQFPFSCRERVMAMTEGLLRCGGNAYRCGTEMG